MWFENGFLCFFKIWIEWFLNHFWHLKKCQFNVYRNICQKFSATFWLV
ncbi:hypothetical Protein pso3_07980 [Candidatus Phytoplasma solani]